MEKTNVMRVLDQKKVSYTPYYYDGDGTTTGEEIAGMLNQNPDRVFKTLVTVGAPNKYYVFDVPVNRELNLKKAAKAVGEKKIEMVKSKELLPLTGYIHGGCSPIGMKKCFPTFIDESVLSFNTIFFSAGRIGAQIEISPSDLKKIVNYRTLDLCKE